MRNQRLGLIWLCLLVTLRMSLGLGCVKYSSPFCCRSSWISKRILISVLCLFLVCKFQMAFYISRRPVMVVGGLVIHCIMNDSIFGSS